MTNDRPRPRDRKLAAMAVRCLLELYIAAVVTALFLMGHCT